MRHRSSLPPTHPKLAPYRFLLEITSMDAAVSAPLERALIVRISDSGYRSGGRRMREFLREQNERAARAIFLREAAKLAETNPAPPAHGADSPRDGLRPAPHRE